MRIRKIIACLALCVVLLCSCTEADKVSHNIAKEADNFNVYRRVVIINTRTDKPEFEVIGKLSVTIGEEKMYIIVEDDGKFYKHIVNLTANNIYVVEDLGGAEVSKYDYEINYIPQQIVPITVTMSK